MSHAPAEELALQLRDPGGLVPLNAVGGVKTDDVLEANFCKRHYSTSPNVAIPPPADLDRVQTANAGLCDEDRIRLERTLVFHAAPPTRHPATSPRPSPTPSSRAAEQPLRGELSAKRLIALRPYRNDAFATRHQPADRRGASRPRIRPQPPR